jgi:predicted transport protein
LKKKSDVLKRLKSEFGLGHVQAQTVVWRIEGEMPYVETAGYEEAIFKVTFELYQELKRLIVAVSDEVTVKPCKSYVPFYRKNQFAILTEKNGKLILGLNLDNEAHPELRQAERLGGSDRITKMIMVQKDNLKQIELFIHEAFKRN